MYMYTSTLATCILEARLEVGRTTNKTYTRIAHTRQTRHMAHIPNKGRDIAHTMYSIQVKLDKLQDV